MSSPREPARAQPNRVCSCQAKLWKRLRRFGYSSLAAETYPLGRHSDLVTMSVDDVRQLLSNWPWLVLAVVIVWPVVHFLYNHRISGLKEDLERLRARLDEQIAATSTSNRDDGLRDVASPQEVMTLGVTTALPSSSGVATASSAVQNAPILQGRGVWHEIMTAYRALPPLERESGLRAAYKGTVIRGTAVVNMVWESISSLAVLVVTAENESFILSFPESRRAEVGTLREGQTISFEGRFGSVGHMHVELVDPTFQHVE